MDSDERRRAMSKLRVDVESSSPSDSSDDDREGRREVTLSHHHNPAAAAAVADADDGSINRHRRLLSKQLSMKETTREAKWEKRRRQILQRGSMVAVNEAVGERARCLTDEDLDERRGSFELGFGFDEEKGGANLCDTLPALDLYFAVNRQLSDPKLRSPT